VGDVFVEQGGEHSKKIKVVYQTRPSTLFELTFNSSSRDMYLLRRISTFHLTSNGEVVFRLEVPPTLKEEVECKDLTKKIKNSPCQKKSIITRSCQQDF
jgi:hypothetical protein